jgi:hypothetical protein
VAGKVIVNPPERKVTTPMRVGRPVILNLCIHRCPPLFPRYTPLGTPVRGQLKRHHAAGLIDRRPLGLQHVAPLDPQRHRQRDRPVNPKPRPALVDLPVARRIGDRHGVADVPGQDRMPIISKAMLNWY